MNSKEFLKLKGYVQIRHLTAIVPKNVDSIIDRLALCNLIARYKLGLAEKKFFEKQIKKTFGEDQTEMEEL